MPSSSARPLVVSRRKKRRRVEGKNHNNEGDGHSQNDSKNHTQSDDGSTNFVLGACDNVSERYEKLGRRLGEGTYGIVYQAKDRVTGRFVALKRCIPHHEASDGFPITTLREIQSLRLCRHHPNIVQLENISVSRSGVFLVFEYCEHDLSNLIDGHFQKHKKSPFAKAHVKTLLRHLLEAVNFLHKQCHVIHRDIKLSNLLYTSTGYLKLADFGLSRPYSDDMLQHDGPPLTPNVASLWYRPMELLLGATSYSTQIDVWAVGCIFGELLTGKPLLQGRTELDQIHLIVDGIGLPPQSNSFFWNLPKLQDGTVQLETKKSRRTLWRTLGDSLSPAGLQLALGMLQLDSQARLTAQQALESPYLTSTKELPLPTPPEKMPRFPRSFPG